MTTLTATEKDELVASMFHTIVTENQLDDKEWAARNVLRWIRKSGLSDDETMAALESAIDHEVPEERYEVEKILLRLLPAATEKAREARFRRLAAKLGYRLTKGKPNMADAEPGYMILNGETGGADFGTSEGGFGYMADLDGIEEWLKD